VKRVYAYDANRLLCLSGEYGPVYLYTPATKEIEYLGIPTYSLYDAIKIGTKWYLSGYTAVTLEWDPAQPWTLTDSTIDRTTSNPRQVLGVHKYHYYSTEGSDGLLYVGVSHLRDSVGGDLGWFNPADDSVGHLREGFEDWNPRGVVAVGDSIVYSGNSLSGAEGQLIVFDTATKTIVDAITPLSGEGNTSAGWIIAIEGDIIGISDLWAYRVTVATGATVWKVSLPAWAFNDLRWYDRRAEIGPDGLIYLYLGTVIYSLDPATGATAKVVDDLATGNIMWHEGTAYIYGRTNLRKLTPP